MATEMHVQWLAGVERSKTNSQSKIHFSNLGAEWVPNAENKKAPISQGPTVTWLRGLDLNQRPSGYEATQASKPLPQS